VSVRKILKIRKGSASAFNVGRSDYCAKLLGEVANLAASGDRDAETIMKLVKEAKKKAEKYGQK
jgi:hypothetical protein